MFAERCEDLEVVWRRQFQGRNMHAWPCVKIILRRIRGGIKAWKIKQRKQFQMQFEIRLKRHLIN